MFRPNKRPQSVAVAALFVISLACVVVFVLLQGVSLAIGPKVFLITFKVIDVI
jgi:hypothetical protein